MSGITSNDFVIKAAGFYLSTDNIGKALEEMYSLPGHTECPYAWEPFEGYSINFILEHIENLSNELQSFYIKGLKDASKSPN